MPNIARHRRSNHRMTEPLRWLCGCALLLLGIYPAGTPLAIAEPLDLVETIDRVQSKMVKVYGAGGPEGLEAYQSGFLISPTGHVLTIWSYVLDTPDLQVVLHDGGRFPAEILGSDPRLEIALLKIDGKGLNHYNLQAGTTLDAGSRILAFSNLYGIASGDEPTSVLKGVVANVTQLAGRRGAYETPYHGIIYTLDAVTNNAGAAGGALTDYQGNLAGILGKEIRHATNHTWLNYAIPTSQLVESVKHLMEGRSVAPDETNASAVAIDPVTLEIVGISLIPNVLDHTPPFVDRVRGDSPAQRGDIRPDDLVVMIENDTVRTCQAVEDRLARRDRSEPLRITVLRQQTLIEFKLDLVR